jgi:hypothetical protein
VTYSVTVNAPGAGSPSGTVKVSDGADQCLGTLPATSCQLASSTPGVKSLIATFAGDVSFQGSASSGAAHVVSGSAHQLGVTRAGSGAGTVTSEDLTIDCGAICTQSYADGSTVTLTATPDAGSVFTGWLGGCTGTAQCSITIAATTSVSATFAPDTIGPQTLDLDDNGAYDALTDGLLALRDLFGLSGASLVTDAVGAGAQRATPAAIAQYVTDVLPRLDVDGNGQADALTDGLLVIRYLFGVRGASLVAGAIGTGATRTTAAAVETYLQSLTP